MSATEIEIDDSLYSRQRYVLGDSAMHKLAASNVFLFGVGGLGVEIAKNLVLAGVKSIAIHDARPTSRKDMGCQFFVREEDISMNRSRAQASIKRLTELNSYVNVILHEELINEKSNLDFLSNFQCVVMTECIIELQVKVNKFCRDHSPPIKFISADVYGLACWSFCDFGDEFEVSDTDGEEPQEVVIGSITKSNPGVVSTVDSIMHGFEDEDTVIFEELTSMQLLNRVTCQIKVLSPHQFSIIDTSSDDFPIFHGRGIVKKVKTKRTISFKSLEIQMTNPSYLTSDLSKVNAPMSIHLAMLTLHKFCRLFKRPMTAWDKIDCHKFLSMAECVCNELDCVDWESIDQKLVEYFSYTSQGCFPPLCAFLGGVVAQEVLKALSNKFTPIQQWLHFDAIEIAKNLDDDDDDTLNFEPTDERYDLLRTCIGNDLCEKLKSLKIFMIGCGAIGCELLKNFALIGVGSLSGLVTITDNDLIEKSNLNRQFLFRSEHIQKPKSVTAALSVLQINPEMKILPQQHRVGWETEVAAYPDSFFANLDVVVNALDNVEARRYMDNRCVSNQKPLLESGTMSTKGHVQVIVPFLTESYNSQNDPIEGVDVPYCTLRSFPANIEHCIEWARDKFENMFVQKINLYNDFWKNYTPDKALDKLKKGMYVDNCKVITKRTCLLPINWIECIYQARNYFEKFFNFKAQELLIAFPLDTTLTDGSPFWQLPKRPPTPVRFDSLISSHLSFVTSCAKLLASVCGIRVKQENLQQDVILSILSEAVVPAFVPKNKRIETDEAAKKPQKQEEATEDDVKLNINRLNRVLNKFGSTNIPHLHSVHFEKDDDSNGHIDFIASTSNLRASMYGISDMDRLQIKKIAGRIVPAIATTTAAVSALVTIELVKIAKQLPLEGYRNTFLNLALPLFVLSEPGKVKKTVMGSGYEYTIWDRWEITGNPNLTVDQFMKAIKGKYKEEPVFIVQGTKLIFSADMLMIHRKRLNQRISSLLKVPPNKPYVDLVVSFKKGVLEDGSTEDETGPEIRYYHGMSNHGPVKMQN